MQVLAASSEVSSAESSNRIQLQREQVTLICEVPEQSRCASSNLWWQKHQGTFLFPSLSPHSNCIKEIQLERGRGGEGEPTPSAPSLFTRAPALGAPGQEPGR